MNAFIIQIVETAFTVLVWLIIGRCILSFIRHDPYHPIIKFIYEVTEPVMSPFRRLLPLLVDWIFRRYWRSSLYIWYKA